MKKIIYTLAALAGLALVACNKEDGPAAPKMNSTVSVEIVGGSLADETKSTYADAAALTENEGKVYNLQVFVFNNSGSREGYASKDNVKALEVSCKSGAKTVCAIVNAPSLSEVTTLSDLEKSSYTLSQMSPEKFIMYGSTSQYIEGNTDVTIDVNRLVARIVIRAIENRFKLETYQSKPFEVTAIYVTNAQGENSLGLKSFQASDGTWYNKMKHETSSVESMLYDAVGSSVAYQETYSTAHYFYACPNDFKASESTPDSYAGDWCKRYTRLVVEAKLDGETVYYPITMNLGFEANKSYEIDKLVITKRGSDDPDIPVDSEDIVVKINVKDWDVVILGNEGVVTI